MCPSMIVSESLKRGPCYVFWGRGGGGLRGKCCGIPPRSAREEINLRFEKAREKEKAIGSETTKGAVLIVQEEKRTGSYNGEEVQN